MTTTNGVARVFFRLLLGATTLFAAGCAPQSAKQPQPITLSFPFGTPPVGKFPGYRALAKRVLPGYARLTIYDKSPGYGGSNITNDVEGRTVVIASAILIDRQGYLITAAHIAKSKTLGAQVLLADGRTLGAVILDVSPNRELALLRTTRPPGVTPALLGDSSAIARREPVLAIGSPGLRAGVVSVGTVRIEKRHNRLQYGKYGFDNGIELNMEVESGDSGGPVFNADGAVIGMIAGFLLGDTSKTPYVSPHIAFAVPVNAISAYLAEYRRR